MAIDQSRARQQAVFAANGNSATCRCLMSKAKILNLQFDPTVPPSNDGSYWCVHTQTVIGPDGKVAEPEACQSGRSCYDRNS